MSETDSNVPATATDAAPGASSEVQQPAANEPSRAPRQRNTAAGSGKQAESDVAKSKTQPITMSRHALTEVVAARHSISPEAGTPFEDVLKPGYFANIASKLHPTDIIEVRPEEGSYYAELIVWNAGKAHANVSPVMHVKRPSGMTMKIVEGFEVEFRAGPTMYRVVRASDGTEIKSGFSNPDDATDWLIANRKQFAA